MKSKKPPATAPKLKGAKATKPIKQPRRAKRAAAPERNRGGRPTLYSPQMTAAICGWIRQGYTLRQIGELPNMPSKTTIIDWLGQHPEFSDQYARAHEIQALVMEDEIRDIAEDGRNDWLERETKQGGVELVPNEELLSRRRLRVDTLKWLMEKKAPKRFGRQVAVTGKDGGAVKVEHLGAILDEISGSGTGLPGDGTKG